MEQQYHYAKGGSNTAAYVHGLYRKNDEKLYGVAWWLPPTKVCCQSVNRNNWTKVLSLTRLVILPQVAKNSASFLISKSIKMIKKDGRFVSLVTYADESQGHLGTIYKASNWIYIGKTKLYPRWIDKTTGRQVSIKATKSRTKEQMILLGYVKVGSFCKHKFVIHF